MGSRIRCVNLELFVAGRLNPVHSSMPMLFSSPSAAGHTPKASASKMPVSTSIRAGAL
jgi:hypothetical protein